MNFKNECVRIGLILFLALGMMPLAHSADSKFAFVDVAKVFDEYEKTKDNDRMLQESGRKKEEERDALVHEVRQIKDEMLLLSDDAKEKKQSVLEAKVKDLREFDQQAKEQLSNQRGVVVREIFKDIDDAVQRYGERKGIDYIFNERALLFHNPRHDVTEDILKEVNKSYSKNK